MDGLTLSFQDETIMKLLHYFITEQGYNPVVLHGVKDEIWLEKMDADYIITTEKDIMRLSLPEIYNELKELPIFYIPIEICFHGNDKEEFDNKILKYVTANSRN